jgi:hypothetical protein
VILRQLNHDGGNRNHQILRDDKRHDFGQNGTLHYYYLEF